MRRIIPSIAACVAMGVCLYVSYVPGNTTEKYKKEESMYSRTWINQSAEDVKKNIQKEAAEETEKEADKEVGSEAVMETETKTATEKKEKEHATEKTSAMTETPQTDAVGESENAAPQTEADKESESETPQSKAPETEHPQTEAKAPETEEKQTESRAPETETKQTKGQAPGTEKVEEKESETLPAETARESESAAPQTEVPKTEAKQTEVKAPETEAKQTETQAPETEAKQTETQAPETEAKQTETPAPETEAKQPETQAPKQIKKYGKENDVKNVQYMLSLRGYDVSHTGKMNRETKSAIKEYRKEKGLSDGDYIDDELLEALGIRNANIIKEIQTKLSDIGYSVGTPDGLIGRRTQDAIESYKADKDLGNGSEINDDVLKALGIIRETAKAEKKAVGETKGTGEKVLTPNFKKDITDLPDDEQEKFVEFDEWLNDNLNTDKLKEGNKTDEEAYPYIIKQVLDACYDIVKDDDPDNKAEISKKFQTLISYDNDKFNVAKFSDGEITRLYEAAYEAVS